MNARLGAEYSRSLRAASRECVESGDVNTRGPRRISLATRSRIGNTALLAKLFKRNPLQAYERVNV